MITNKVEEFVGVGPIFPITLDAYGKVPLYTGYELIKASLTHILSWNVGTRYMLGEFGSYLEILLEEPNDNITMAIIKTYIIDAITKWEKRIAPVSISVSSISDYGVKIELRYRIINTKLEDTFIFPYYSVLKY